MGKVFAQLTADIEAEAQAEGPGAVAQLRILETRFRIATAIIQLRHAHGLTQRQLSALSGIGQAEISDIERGAVGATEDTLARLTTPLGHHLALVPDGGGEMVTA